MKNRRSVTGAAIALISLPALSLAQGILGVNPVAPDDTTPSVGAPDLSAPVLAAKFKVTAPGTVASLAFSPDSSELAAGCDGHILIWDTSGAVAADLKVKAAELLGTKRPAKGDHKTRGRGSGDKTESSDSTVNALLWSPDGSKLAALIGTAGVGIWDVSAGHLLVSLTEPKISTTSMAWSMDGKTIATGTSKGEVRLWDAATGAALKDLGSAGVAIQKLGFNVNGKGLTGLGPPPKKSSASSPSVTIARWDLATGAVTGNKEIVISGDIEPKSPDLAIDGEYFVNATDFNALHPYEVWNTRTMAADFGVGPQTRESDFENAIHMSPYADEFLACGWGIRLYSVFDKSLIASIADPDGTYTYQKLIAAPATLAKNRWVAIALDDTIRVYGP